MAGIQEIADLTGLSKATVSRALRGLPVVAPSTVVAVRDAAESLGYIPSASASGLATGRNRAIGVIVPPLALFHSTVQSVAIACSTDRSCGTLSMRLSCSR